MADSKISALPNSTTAPADTDAFVTVEDMTTVPVTKRKAWSILKAAISGLLANVISFTATDKILGRQTAGAGAGEEITCTAAGRAILDDADAAAQRATLGMGTLALINDAPSDGTTYGRKDAAWVEAGGGDGWTSANQTWTYASATTITVPSGAAAIYSVGDKIKLTANSVVLYAYVIGVADTVLTVVGNALTNHTFTANFYSKASSPINFPQWFAYTPSGVSATNVNKNGRFSISGRICTAYIHLAFAGAITFTTFPGLPVAASGFSGAFLGPSFGTVYHDASPYVISFDTIVSSIRFGGTVIEISNMANTAFLSAIYPITWANGDFLEVQVSYEI